MKKLLLFGGALAFTLNAYSQTIIFQENFENGTSNWQLNGGTGDNSWVVNNVYAGFSGFIADTPAQPSTFTGGTNSKYMHITNGQFCGFGYCNASFETGSASDQSATMANSVSTTGSTGVSLSFWYLSEGAAGTSYGTVEYSTDGTTWTQAGNQLSGVSTWTQLTLTDAAFDNKATLKFRFRWQNGAAGDDPAFSVDEIKLTGTSGTSSNAIATSAVTPMTACFNTAQNVSVPFNATGTYTSGNIFTAQLSDASGAFASPVSIGTLASAASGNLTINATIPAGTAAGAGYRIRVVSSAPATTGADNGSNITVYALPAVDITSVPSSGTINAGQSITLTATGGTTYAWSPSTNLSSATGATVDANPSVTTTYTVTATDAHGCTGTDNITVTVNSTAGVGEVLMDQNLALYPNPATEYFEVFHNYNAPITRLVIRDNNGRRIRTYDKPKPEKFFIADLGSGVYSVAVTILEETYIEKLVIP